MRRSDCKITERIYGCELSSNLEDSSRQQQILESSRLYGYSVADGINDMPRNVQRVMADIVQKLCIMSA